MAIVSPAAAVAAVDATATLPERPLFRILGTQDGLPSSTQFKLAQDSDGNLWIATLDGLARYDSVGFTVWRHDPDDPDSLPGNDIQSVMVDELDQVWVAVQDGGIARYRPADDRFDVWRHDPQQPDHGLWSNRIWTLAADGDGGIWFGGYGSGLGHMDRAGSIQRWSHDPAQADSLCHDDIYTLATGPETSGPTLWIGGLGGLCRYHPRQGFTAIAIPMPRDHLGNVTVSGIRIDGDRLWLATNAGVRVLDTSPGAGTALVELPAVLTGAAGAATVQEPDGTLWFASSNGIRRWHPLSRESAIHRARPGRAFNLQQPRFMDVVRDHEGSLWFASFGGGLAQLVPRWRAVRVFLADPDNPAGLPSSRVQSINRDRAGQLWVVTDRQSPIAELDPVSGLSRRWFPAGADDVLPDRVIMAALRDARGRIWTTHRGAVARFDPATQRLDVISHDQAGSPLPPTPSRVIAEHPDGTLIASFGGNGILLVDIASLQARFNPLGEERGLPCAEIYAIHVDDQGGIWLACNRGILHASGTGEPFRVPAGAPNSTVDDIYRDADGSLWLHSIGELMRYRVDGPSLTRILSIGSARGWPPVRAGGIIVDGDGVVWATTTRGLYAYDPALDQVHGFDQNDGLPSAEFSDTPPLRFADHYLAAGTTAGPVLVDTRALRASLPAARLRWHEVSVARNGQRVSLTPVDDRPLQLAHGDRDLIISVRLNSHIKPSAHRYRFRLEGLDKDWAEQTGQPERRYEQLGSGQYRLEVEALVDGDQPAMNTLMQAFEVTPPPWRQPWAFLGYLLAAALLSLALHRAYRRRLLRTQALAMAEERQQWAEQANEAKTRFLADIGHEIRTPMAGLLGMNDLLLRSRLDHRQRHYARDIRRAGNHMLNLINDLLDLSRIEAGKLKLDLRPHDLVVLIDELIGDVASQAEAKGLSLSLRIEPEVPLSVTIDGKRLKQILLNLLGNAVKFTESGRVRLHLRLDQGQHQFAVEDEGAGLSDEIRKTLFNRFSQDDLGRRTGGSGLGLAIARELTALMGGDIGAENRHGPGSRFWVRLPLAETAGPATEALDLPPLLVCDDDAERADDLAVSLRALAADARTVNDLSKTAPRNGTIVLLRAATLADAEKHLARLPQPWPKVILGLPLGAPLPTLATNLRVLSGPWRLRDVLAACRNESLATFSSPGPGRNPDLAGIRLLLVEDDAALREVMATRLADMRAEVAQAENGLSALARLGNERFDAVLLDLDLPQLDGLQVLKLARQQLGERAPPFVVITARQRADDEAECRAAGALAFHRKPVDLDEMAVRLKAHLDQAAKIR